MTRRIAVKKNILAPAVALSLGLAGSLGAIAAPAFADETAQDTPTSKPQQEEQPTAGGTTPAKPGEGDDAEDLNNSGEGDTGGDNENSGEGEQAAPDNGSATISADKLTLSEFREKGVEVSYTGGEPGNPVDFSLQRKGGDTEIYSEQLEADENGNAKAAIRPKIDDENAEKFLGEYEVVVNLDFGMSGVNIDTLPFTVVADEDDSEEEGAPAEDPALDLSKKKVVAVDFVNKEKGLNAVVSNLEPGTEVKFNVAGTSGNAKNVRPFKQTVTADKDGNAVFSVAGTSKDNPSAYLGKYTVIAEFDDQKLEGSFEVVSGKGSDAGESEESGSGGGSVSSGASDDVSGSTTSGSSDYLPRTGQGLGALAAGAALLTVGGATVLLTRRTRKA